MEREIEAKASDLTLKFGGINSKIKENNRFIEKNINKIQKLKLSKSNVNTLEIKALKTPNNNKIQNLYDYVTSLGEEIYTEKENKNFSLNQPFPPKKYENMDNTLEQENLFPNAVIQIREE